MDVQVRRMCPAMLEAKKNNKVSSQRMLGDKASLFDELGKKKDLFSSEESKLNI